MNVDLAAVFGIGAMTLATPCVLPLLPIYLGLLLGEGLESAKEKKGRFRLFTATLAFAAGFTLVFTLLGLGASSLGSALQAHRETLMLGGAILIVLFGLKFLGVFRVALLDRELRLPELKTGLRLLDAALFGVVFALGWTPCVGPILGSVLTYAASRASDPWTGALYLATYGMGVATPLIVLSLFADRLVPLVGRLNKHIPKLERVTGVALLLLGVYLGYGAIQHAGWLDDADEGPSVAVLAPDGGMVEGDAGAPVGEPSARPRVVEFFRPGCHACQRARAAVEALREDCAGRQIEILMVNAEAPGNRELARQYGLTVVPTFVLLDTQGQERGRLVGAPQLEDLRFAAASLMEETCAGVEGAGQDGLDQLDELLDDQEEGCSADDEAGAEGGESCSS